jgi:uncharacterized protein (TIGR02145 family)
MKRSLIVLFVVVFACACEKNHPPVITEISCAPENRSAGTEFALIVTASDADGDALQYHWSADGGAFTDSINTKKTKWKSPVDGTGRTYILKVTVSDGKLETFLDYPIVLSEAIFGQISGNAYFTNCTIPVAGAIILVDDRTTETDSTGYFSLTDIPVGNYTLKANKASFSPVEMKVNIKQSVNLKLNISMTTVTFSCKVSGIIKDLESIPVSGTTVTMLNPDLSESKITATSDVNGYYLLRNVPLGQRKIIAHKGLTTQYCFTDVKLDLAITGPEYPLDIEMEKYPLTGQFTDRRDGHQYGYKIFGTQTWMTENLAYLPSVNPPTEGNDNGRFCYVYGYSGKDTAAAKATENYNMYGVLYNWNTAQGICPAGWHLPSAVEWNILTDYIGPGAGYAMKSDVGWSNRGNGSNSSGFTALPAGGRGDGLFAGFGSSTKFWTSMYWGIQLGQIRWLDSNEGEIWAGGAEKSDGNSVRCMKDHSS